MKDGDGWPNKHDLSSLRILATVGEPINPEAWMWYYNVIGKGKCPIIDTYWQTETGGFMLTPLPGATPIKPGSATMPFFGIDPAIIREDGSPCDVNEGGYLVIKKPWPGLMRSVYGDPARFKSTYFTRFPGVYTTGDGARKDEDGYYWLMGRIDDVIKVSGHRIGTAEVESAFVAHPERGRSGGCRYAAPDKRRRHLCLCDLKIRRAEDRRTEERTGRLGAQTDWAAGFPG